jgi:hypothetical protein
MGKLFPGKIKCAGDMALEISGLRSAIEDNYLPVDQLLFKVLRACQSEAGPQAPLFQRPTKNNYYQAQDAYDLQFPTS